jgi:UDP-N-acetylmuramoyl-tripeptide--D-alanyl-D-alanine ligase
MSGLLAICVSMILSPLEFLNSLKYIKIAKNKLLNLNAIKIGISGSYGKTSCKNILGAMLAKKYKVIKTEGNRNTPMGICLTTNNMTSDAEVFIAEMGARRRGDIKKLCDIVKPTCALLTGISNQHMSEFGSLEKIYQTKSELIKALPRDGIAIFNGDDPLITKLRKEFTGDSVAVHLRDEQEVYAKNIKLSTNGISFEIFGLSTPFKVSTKLLGRHNVLNILMCSVMAYKLGISPNEIASALSELEPIPHRLQIIKNTGEITIIDDSYNANISGSIFALEVLKLYSGRKIVFSQGLVELGKLNNRYNRHLGAVIGKTADVIILTGQNTNSLLKGIDSVGFSGTVYRYKSFKEATVNIKEILKPGDVLLIQNDIP